MSIRKIQGKLSEYQFDYIIDFITQGQYGRVFRGLDLKMNRHVAIKISTGFEEREINVLVTLKNKGPFKHIVTIIEVIKCKQNTYTELITITELAEGSLGQYLQQRKISDDCFKISLCFQIVSGIVEIHNNGFMHRDIKPDNILYFLDNQKKMTLKICDIGEARAINGNSITNNVGTVGYIAPEVEIESFQYDGKVDMWSFGVIMFEILSLNKMRFKKFKEQQDIDKYIDNLNVDIRIKPLLKQLIQIDPKNRLSSKEAKISTMQILIEMLKEKAQQQENNKEIEKAIASLDELILIDPDVGNNLKAVLLMKQNFQNKALQFEANVKRIQFQNKYELEKANPIQQQQLYHRAQNQVDSLPKYYQQTTARKMDRKE